MQDISASQTNDTNVPLCVDLDGTLIRSDILVESALTLLKTSVLNVFFMALWLLKGKAHLKQNIAERVELNITTLPYNRTLLEYLREENRKGRSIILVTASNIKFASKIADHLGFFDDVIASDACTNVSGKRKLAMILSKFDKKCFDYAANAKVDLEIWPHSRNIILVNPEKGVRAAAEKLGNVSNVFQDLTYDIFVYIRAVRLHQWIKNLLVFIPLLAAHRYTNLDLMIQSVIAFFSFGLCASSVYILNDLLDLSADRSHPRKRKRPFAIGAIPITHGIILIPVLLVSSFSLALLLPFEFIMILALYYLSTLAYSLKLKRMVMFDVLILAGLYTLRILGGAAATSITPSFWLLAFSMFIFFSLALVKRYTELLSAVSDNDGKAHGRGYDNKDADVLLSFGAASGNLAVLVLALYINDKAITSLYSNPEVIWILCPLLLYWISRIWICAKRGEVHDDPLVFAVKDQLSLGVSGIGLIVIMLAL